MFGRPNAAVLLLLLVVAAALVIPGSARPGKDKKNQGKSKSETCGYCLPNPCKNSGECSVEEDGSGFKCTCPLPFRGTTCNAVEMDVAIQGVDMYLFDDNIYGRNLGVLYPSNSAQYVVNNYLTFLAYAQGFSIRVNGTFLGGDEMLCREPTNADDIEVNGEFVLGWKEPDFLVPDTWVIPVPADFDDLFFPGDVEGSTIPAPDDKKLMLSGIVGDYIICWLELDDLKLNLLE